MKFIPVDREASRAPSRRLRRAIDRPLLRGAKLEVIARDLGQQGHPQRPLPFAGGGHFGVRGLERPLLGSAENIEFPGGIKADLIEIGGDAGEAALPRRAVRPPGGRPVPAADEPEPAPLSGTWSARAVEAPRKNRRPRLRPMNCPPVAKAGICTFRLPRARSYPAVAATSGVSSPAIVARSALACRTRDTASFRSRLFRSARSMSELSSGSRKTVHQSARDSLVATTRPVGFPETPPARRERPQAAWSPADDSWARPCSRHPPPPPARGRPEGSVLSWKWWGGILA